MTGIAVLLSYTHMLAFEYCAPCIHPHPHPHPMLAPRSSFKIDNHCFQDQHYNSLAIQLCKVLTRGQVYEVSQATRSPGLCLWALYAGGRDCYPVLLVNSGVDERGCISESLSSPTTSEPTKLAE